MPRAKLVIPLLVLFKAWDVIPLLVLKYLSLSGRDVPYNVGVRLDRKYSVFFTHTEFIGIPTLATSFGFCNTDSLKYYNLLRLNPYFCLCHCREVPKN